MFKDRFVFLKKLISYHRNAGKNSLIVLCITCLSSMPPLVIAAPATTVITKTITTSQITPNFEALGTLKADESVILSATVTETVSAIHFDDGSQVNAGDVLIEMTSMEEQAQLKEAQSAVAEAKRQYDRLTTLIKSDSTSQSLLDEKRLAYESAKARVNASMARLDDHSIKAPFSGRVGLRNISLGTLVKPGDMITTLDKVDTLKLDMTLPATALKSVRQGMQITAVALADNKIEYRGVIRSVDTRVDPITRSILVRAVIQNTDYTLRPGMQMSAQITSQPQNALLIPEESLVRSGDKEFIYLVVDVDGQLVAKQQTISTLGRYQGDLLVDDGLNSGDIIVVHGNMKIKNGSPVSVLAEEKNNESLDELLKSTKEKNKQGQ